ncbi:MAG: D-glycero-beta-D-manno-heptose 1,7-bisphosphate 7-phosphatase [Gammaproteobacteria bacterium]|nr:D-glycero-beta-D-manno-heptose 1,7-bisphosphate 7-phosphatase [Gammaproteobacteria bacterium]
MSNGDRSRLVILDRDGVLNEDSDAFIKSPAEWSPIAGSMRAVARLNQAGYRVVVATNQSGIARGLFDLDTLGLIHEKMRRALADVGGHVDGIFFCPHGPDDGCDCRKPLPGLFEQISQRFDVDLKAVPAIGDSLRDLKAAQAVGAVAMLVRTGKGLRTLANPDLDPEIPVFQDLSAAIDTILETRD